MLGLIALTTGFLWIDGSAQYPGISATIPVLGTAAIIIASTHGAPNLRLLRNRVALAIGNRSYALHLVHWPIIGLIALTAARPAPPTTAPLALGHGSPYGAPALAGHTTFLTGDKTIYPDPDTAAKSDWALVGDSHATQWLPALQDNAEEQSWRIETYLHSSCAFSSIPRSYNSAQDSGSCVSGRQHQKTRAHQLRSRYRRRHHIGTRWRCVCRRG